MILAALLLYTLFVCTGTSETKSKELLEKVFKTQSRFVRPVTDINKPVQTAFGIELIQIASVNNREQILTTKCYVRQRWVNEFHQWNSSQWDGIKSVNIDANEIWVPDIVLYNNGGETFAGGTELYKTNVQVLSDGSAQWLAPATFVSSCDISIRHFPFDRQTCYLQFGSWTHNAYEINLTTYGAPLITSLYLNSSEWSIKEYKETINSVKYNCCPEPYLDITFTFVLDRKPLFYIFNVVLPCIMLVMTILFGFFLPPESGERISLTITILLAVAVFLELVNATLPRNSDTIPILAIFFIVMMALSVLSLMTTCIILVIHYQSAASGVPMPLWIKKNICGRLAHYLCVKRNTGEKLSKTGKNYYANNAVTVEKLENFNFKILDKFSKSSGQIHQEENGCIGNLRQRKNGEIDHPLIMDKILEELKVITSSINEEQEKGENQEDWIFLGRVLDRLFFIVFLATTCLSCIMIFVPVYLQRQ